MTNQHFTHLHLHTEFSLLDGAIRLDKLIEYGKQNSFKALAITDHGNIFGAVQFFQQCKKAGIKPILGIEAYFTEDATIRNSENKYYHMILLVENETGYKNLCKLISYSFKEGFYFKPRIDFKILAQHCEGLIVTSACLGGYIPQLLKHGETEKVKTAIAWFLEHFGKDRFYLEVQPEDQPEQTTLNNQLYELAKEYNLNLLAAGDCHYINASDREAHEVMLSVQTQGKLSDPSRYTFGACRVHIRTQEEMLELFKNHPEAVWNSGLIADRCNFDFKTGVLHFPTFIVPEGYTQESYFDFLCRQGFQELIDNDFIPLDKLQSYEDRLNLEIELITKMGYVGYLLVVGDFIQWAKNNGIPVGPGRGSAVGSLASWALKITNVDPLKYNLFFERFLNPERVSMPDIDIDFCIEGREKVINYVRDKYGHDNVCQIITFGTMMAKGVLKDVARVLSIPFEDANALTALIPTQLEITLEEAKEQEPRLQEMIDSNPQVKRLFEIAQRLEGLTRHASKHAAGIVISPEKIDDVLPVYIPAKTDDLVTQYAMTELESLGFLKMDFLGLKTLTVIDRTLKMIKEKNNILINLDKIPLDDEKTFKLICRGDTSGVFQLESSGLKEVLRKLQPNKFEDIIAVNALYRPGPLGSGMVDDFIERRHGRQKVTYILPELQPVLEETYGVIVYQEQVMKIASVVSGYSLGEADILRRAMGKKKAEVMAEQSAIFVKMAEDRKVNGKKAKEIFDLMAYFAGYGFNKAHSAAYALIAYQTAYLKAHYPAEYMATLLSLESGNAEKLSFYLDEVKSMGLTLLPPDINQSLIDFSVVNGSILFGLQGIKNVGITALNTIIEQRAKKPFKNILEFCARVDLRTVNKRVIEHLIFAGAFDLLPGNRAQKTEELSQIMDQAIEQKHALSTGQMGLFSAAPTTDSSELHYAFQPRADWTNKEKLEKEKEVVGFYLSAHPLDTYKKQLKRFSFKSFEALLEESRLTNTMDDIIVYGCGLLKSKRIISTKKGDRMAFVQLEDYVSKTEVILFPSLFKKVEKWLDNHEIFVVKGAIETSGTTCKILANECVPLELFLEEWKLIPGITLQLPHEPNQEILEILSKILKTGNSLLTFNFEENGKNLILKTRKKISINTIIIDKLEEQKINVKISL